MLTACYVTTDGLAVYEYATLNSEEVEAISGHYHLLDPNGSFSSLTFTSRSDPWPYQQDYMWQWFRSVPFFPQRPQQLPAVSMSFKAVINSEDGDKRLSCIDGVIVFSRIPGTDLMLASIPGETLQIFSLNTGEMAPASDNSKNRNIFFLIKQNGMALTIKLFSENDEGLESAFENPAAPLPTNKLLVWLKKNAVDAFDEENLPTYLRSTTEQKEQVKKDQRGICTKQH